MKTAVIIGVSCDRRKFWNRAVLGFRRQGCKVVAINSHKMEVEGLQDVAPEVDVASFYVSASKGVEIRAKSNKLDQRGMGQPGG